MGRKRGASEGMRIVKEIKSRDTQLINTSPHNEGDSLLILFPGSHAQIYFKLAVPTCQFPFCQTENMWGFFNYCFYSIL